MRAFIEQQARERKSSSTIENYSRDLNDFHMRLKTVPELSLYQWSTPYRRRYKPFLYGIAKAKPEQTRVISTKRERLQPKTLTGEQVETLIAACSHTRDTFLLTLLYHTGMRVGQVLGLRHSDISIEDGAESALEEVRENGLVPAAKYLERAIADLKARLATVEEPA